MRRHADLPSGSSPAGGWRSGLRRSAAAVVAVGVLAGCSATSATHHGAAGAQAGGQVLPSTHVHGVGINPADGLVHLATHDGLFRQEEDGWVQVGEVNDLMGFTIAGPDHFYASGHPGPGSGLPNPVGLVESTDAGRTWTPLSRQGTSDFHALTASAAGVLGFDGSLRTTSDGSSWQEVAIPAAPYSLAAAADGSTVLATTEEGPLRSSDGGRSWEPVPGAPLLMVVDWADGDTVAGLTPEGETAVSTDAGLTWQVRGSTGGRPQAVGATGGGEDLQVLAVSEGVLLVSTDGGHSYA